MKRSIAKLRLEYGNQELLERDLKEDPIQQFEIWLEEAIHAKVMEPNAMLLATSSELSHPTSRIVLLKEVDAKGFVFFTHYESRKAKHLEIHPFGSLTFWWKEIYRQVTLEGPVKKTTRKESVAYFEKRPRGAQLAVYASLQSAPLASREELEERFSFYQKKFRSQKVPCPQSWGGFRLIPERIEFWQGRKNRLHDRFLYVKVNGDWVISRLSP